MLNRVVIQVMEKGWFYLVVISVVMGLMGCDLLPFDGPGN